MTGRYTPGRRGTPDRAASPGGAKVTMPPDAPEPTPDEDHADEPPDRDERRIRALDRMFRRAVEGERRLSTGAMKKIGDALRGDAPQE
jgi:hypothetical protein